MNLQEKIEWNRRREQRRDKYERILRQIRKRVFDYDDDGKLDKAHRIIGKIKKILKPRWEPRVKLLNEQGKLVAR